MFVCMQGNLEFVQKHSWIISLNDMHIFSLKWCKCVCVCMCVWGGWQWFNTGLFVCKDKANNKRVKVGHVHSLQIVSLPFWTGCYTISAFYKIVTYTTKHNIKHFRCLYIVFLPGIVYKHQHACYLPSFLEFLQVIKMYYKTAMHLPYI